MATAYISTTDRDEAELVGRRAVNLVSGGVTGVMVSLERESGQPYKAYTGTTPLEIVANQQKRLPDDFVNQEGNGMTDAFVEYASPLIGEQLPEFERL